MPETTRPTTQVESEVQRSEFSTDNYNYYTEHSTEGHPPESVCGQLLERARIGLKIPAEIPTKSDQRSAEVAMVFHEIAIITKHPSTSDNPSQTPLYNVSRNFVWDKIGTLHTHECTSPECRGYKGTEAKDKLFKKKVPRETQGGTPMELAQEHPQIFSEVISTQENSQYTQVKSWVHVLRPSNRTLHTVYLWGEPLHYDRYQTVWGGEEDLEIPPGYVATAQWLGNAGDSFNAEDDRRGLGLSWRRLWQKVKP
ncbi:hypothetical protein I302_105474 [Kwoniella bestiolae CBS 10118]|uniref:Uncharacterized protein n=1 Tax=Kwoniella bestiolae CBS 10118 TaxID=1296100 RepID=A0A1B9FT77_9TREE|nr:hypothetical protein I302_08756 [Kwoniella bestiolae CBS 10118]OCF21975.1 hypothetical protein I302_08756 [Kwoniella bestiolae CBS 10118]